MCVGGVCVCGGGEGGGVGDNIFWNESDSPISARQKCETFITRLIFFAVY